MFILLFFFKCSHSVYFTIPIHWLNAITGQNLSLNEKSTNDCSTVIENIDFSLESCMGKHNTMECITRRGAGYPLFVQVGSLSFDFLVN